MVLLWIVTALFGSLWLAGWLLDDAPPAGGGSPLCACASRWVSLDGRWRALRRATEQLLTTSDNFSETCARIGELGGWFYGRRAVRLAPFDNAYYGRLQNNYDTHGCICDAAELVPFARAPRMVTFEKMCPTDAHRRAQYVAYYEKVPEDHR